MITPDEIKKKALRQYPHFLSAVVLKETFFPLVIKGRKGSANAPLAQLYASLKYLIDGSKEKIGYGYEVQLKTVNTRHAGQMSIPDQIYFDNFEDYLRYIDKVEEFQLFQQKINLTRQQLPALERWLQEEAPKLTKHLHKWEDLLKVCQYFIDNPQPNLYIRELPIDVHTKFIEQHKGILKKLLDFLLPKEDILIEASKFEGRYGLKYEEANIRMRLLDENLLPEFPTYIQDITLPLNQFQQIKNLGTTIFIVENKQTFLAFPAQPQSTVIWGKGFAIDILKNVDWLKDKDIYFWGDLDVQGFQMLHQLRTYFPQTKSLLMDKETYNAFAKFAVTTVTSNIHNLSKLTKEEVVCFQFLNNLEKNNRLEQERITHQYLVEKIKQL